MGSSSCNSLKTVFDCVPSSDWKRGEVGMKLDRLKQKEVEQLFNAILTLKTLAECYQVFEDFCTVGEIKSIAQRLEVARMLQEGCTYQRIESETGASTATISRVKRCLHDGTGGYQLTLQRLANE
jgi:TrpR-related protein YerC/YecD